MTMIGIYVAGSVPCSMQSFSLMPWAAPCVGPGYEDSLVDLPHGGAARRAHRCRLARKGSRPDPAGLAPDAGPDCGRSW